jgi:hypothetical protein
MNCLECQELIQQRLDDETVAVDAVDLEHHLTLCQDCRELHAAAQRLSEGLRLLFRPSPPEDLGERICGRVWVARRRRQRLRYVLAAGTLAAGLLLTVFAAYFYPRPEPHLGRQNRLVQGGQPRPIEAPPSIEGSFKEGSWAVVNLTRRLADETMGQTRVLLPDTLPDALVGDTELVQDVLEPPAQSLREVRHGVVAGLEPVATSARRAVDLFLRQIPPLVSEGKRGL